MTRTGRNHHSIKKLGFAASAAGAALLFSTAAFAAAPPKLDTGDTAWMLTSTALVLMMTIPGLGLFYGGMVRKKNVLATLAQSFAATCLITVLWMVIGYSLAFKDGGSANGFIGGLSYLFLKPLGIGAQNGTIPESVFATFQMTFAIITPALIAGALRRPPAMFSALPDGFMALWLDRSSIAPIAHWVWSAAGWLGAGVFGLPGAADYRRRHRGASQRRASPALVCAASCWASASATATDNMAPLQSWSCA
jgi:Amt family ammonium transporter